jgi:hypothetical protein
MKRFSLHINPILERQNYDEWEYCGSGGIKYT